jgi:hypothetical protein
MFFSRGLFGERRSRGMRSQISRVVKAHVVGMRRRISQKAAHHVDGAQPPWFSHTTPYITHLLGNLKEATPPPNGGVGGLLTIFGKSRSGAAQESSAGHGSAEPAAEMDSSYRECVTHSDISRVDVRTISVNRGSGTAAECDWIQTTERHASPS